jgi:hypothetical protein
MELRLALAAVRTRAPLTVVDLAPERPCACGRPARTGWDTQCSECIASPALIAQWALPRSVVATPQQRHGEHARPGLFEPLPAAWRDEADPTALAGTGRHRRTSAARELVIA